MNSRRVEHGAWSIGIDSISNVHPSIQPDYYNIESRRGTRISYFRVFYRRLFSMLCESLQIVFWTVSFVCRISPTSTRIGHDVRTYVHTHACAHSSRICIFIVHTRSIRQRDEPPLFFPHTRITFVDLAIFLVEFTTQSRYIAPGIYVRITRDRTRICENARLLYTLFEKKNLMHT